MIIDFYIGRVLMNIDNVLEKMTFEDAMNELESIVMHLIKEIYLLIKQLLHMTEVLN